MTRLARKLLNKEPINGADENGYFHRGFRKNFRLEECGGKRAVDMLLKKMAGEEFISEYIQPIPEKVDPAPCIKDMSKATVALLTTGGMVPAGNPDRIEGSAATKFGVYSMEGLNALEKGKVVSVHGGYDTSFAYEDPNRIVPLDVLRELETNGEIGSVHEFFYSTSGTGAAITKEIERSGIPCAHITAIDPIAHTFGSNRIIHGDAIPHPLAPPDTDRKAEYEARKTTVMKALHSLLEEIR